MAQNISLWGAVYMAVPALTVPKQGGGTARFDDTSDADAAAEDINLGRSAYINGVKVDGSQVIQHYYTGSGTPSASLGENGDIYLKTT